MEDSDYFEVLIGPNKTLYKLKTKFINLLEPTDIIRTVYENMDTKEPIELDQQKTSKELMDIMVKYLENHNYNPPAIYQPIQSDNLKKNLHIKDYELIKDFKIYDDDKLKRLIDFALYLQLKPLYRLCIARIATEFYCGPDQEAFDAMKARVGVFSDLTIEEEKKLIQNYDWLQEDENL